MNSIANVFNAIAHAPVYATIQGGGPISHLSLDSAGKEPLTYAQLALWHKEGKAQVVYFSNAEALTGIKDAGLSGSSGVVWNWITGLKGVSDSITLTTPSSSGSFNLTSSNLVPRTQEVLPNTFTQAQDIANGLLDIYHLDLSGIWPVNPLNPV